MHLKINDTGKYFEYHGQKIGLQQTNPCTAVVKSGTLLKRQNKFGHVNGTHSLKKCNAKETEEDQRYYCENDVVTLWWT